MYGIVRNVFMKDRITGCDTTLYDALRSKRVGHRHAVKIQNLYTHCRLDSFTLIPNVGPPKPASGRNLCILLPDVTLETIAATAHRVSEDKGCHDHPVSAPERAPLALRAIRFGSITRASA